MRVIIAGGREITDRNILREALYACPFRTEITEVITGGASGIDAMGDKWAEYNGIDRTIMPANWYPIYNDKQYLKAAGHKRNKRMANYAEALIAIPGSGPGTRNMIKEAEDQGLKVFVYEAHLQQ